LVQNKELQLIGRANDFASLRFIIEDNPHGAAHISFTGQLSDISNAPSDPLFFLLHTNVDRLWAKWQWAKGLQFNPTSTTAFPNIGNGPPNIGKRINGLGDFSNDTIWPWNNENAINKPGSPRPSTSPGGPFPPSPLTALPGPKPTVGSMIDFHGNFNLGSNLMFAYEDVPFTY
jgi:tyrosinase